MPLGFPDVSVLLTEGGGGTTSVVPKIFPIRLLTIDPLPVGGGGTTVLDWSAMLPLAMRRMSGETSAEGGGAITEGAGIVSRALCEVSRSGEETGGGMIVVLVICTAERETSRLTAPGAGGMMLAFIAGAERERSRERFGAGATTEGTSCGATRVRSRDTLGAGAMTGARTEEFKSGAVCGRSRETFGAGGITDSTERPLRVKSRVTSGAGATTFAGKFGTLRDERMPCDGGGPGFGLIASRLATASRDAGSFRFGASTTLATSDPPRAILMVWVR
jgi:hypothetical protein